MKDPWTEFKERLGNDPSPAIQNFIREYEQVSDAAAKELIEQQKRERQERVKKRK